MHTGALPLRPLPQEAERLRIALIGTGRWGSQLLRVFSALERTRVVAACDVDPDRLAALPSWLRRESEWKRAVSSSDVGAVVIATPPHTHAELTLAALARGKHVFVEKPMATSLGDALRIRQAALAAGRRVMVGLVLHYHPAVGVLARLVERRALGSVTELHAERGGGRRPHAEHPAWWSLAPHDISLAHALFGARATSVSAVRTRRGEHEIVKSTIRFGRGQRALLGLDDTTSDRRRRVVVVGSEATAVFDDLEPVHKLRIYPGAPAAADLRELERALADRRPELPAVASDEPLRLEAAHFVDSVLDDHPFLTGVDHAIDVVSALAAGQRSMLRRGASVPVTDWRAQSAP